MFRKAQLKLFLIIVSILLAVFIAMLGSINIITKAFMQRQSKVVLMQIAAGIEYNDKNSTFTFTRPDDMKEPIPDDDPPPKPDEDAAPPSKPEEEETTEAPATTTITTSTVITSTESETLPPETEPDTQEITEEEQQPDIKADPEPDTVPDTKTTTHTHTEPDKPVQTKPVVTEPPATTTVTVTEPPEMPQLPIFPNDRPERPDDRPWGEGGNDWHNPFWGWGHDNGGNNDWRPFRNTDFSDSAREEGVIVSLADVTTTVPDDTRPFKEKRFDDKLEGPVPKNIGSIDFFVIMADENGRCLSVLNNDELEKDEAQSYVTSVLSKNEELGMVDSCQFYRTEKSNGTLIVLTDKSAEFDMLRQLKRTTVIIGIISVIILSAAAFFLSKKSIQPIKIAFDRQKQFISDASHELKTPLTVISANADVLSEEIGSNKWLTYIKTQTDRMNVLVNDLLNLTRLENNSSEFIRIDFDLSKAIVNTALPFECQAFETNKKFEMDVDDDITVNGSEKHIKQMAAIFIDNALKYSNDGGTVKIMLKKQGDKKILSVFNTGQGVKDEEKDKIFERFYRSDESRNRSTGGYGLGLAIAKSIIDRHKFKVVVENQEGKSICFSVIM